MTNKALFPMLGIVLVAASLFALPPQKGQIKFASKSGPHSIDETTAVAGGSSAGTLSLQRRNPRYQLSQGDILILDFPFTPGFNQTVTVLPDGYISLQGINSLHVEGETVPEVRRSLRQAYAKILHDPVIAVALKDFQKPYFIVGGQVQRPGKFDLRGETTVLQAIEIAGGFNDSAKHSQILLYHRVTNGWLEAKELNLRDMLRGKDLKEDVRLKPGDMLFVPKSTASKIKQFIPLPGMGVYYNPTAP